MFILYNTLARKKQVFKPIGNTVTMYTCGLTVYDYAHIGNLRSFLFEDLLKRTLLLNGFKVKHVQNFTDVGHLVSDSDEGEDKMEVGATREKKTAWEIADFYINAFKEDFKALRMKEPHHWVRATDHIREMIELVKKIEEKGYTYLTEDGVYFNTLRMKGYGKLARLKAKGLKAGARVEMKGKRAPTDFALWKCSPLDRKRDMEWASPWCTGFPGWHIECSAMAIKYLGETIDIHCGGVDHIPVHHTNEIAQSETATGKKFANYWMHNEFMLVDGKKMSKSLGNFYTLKDITSKGFPPTAFRYLCLSVHYRSQMNFTLDSLRDAENAVKSINDFVFRLGQTRQENGTTHEMRHSIPRSKKIESALKNAKEDFMKSINNDLDTPNALAALFKLMKTVNKEIDSGKADRKSADAVREFFNDVNEIFDIFEKEEKPLTPEEKKLIDLRESFRHQKDFKAADEIREQLKGKGIILEDTPEGIRWRRIMKDGAKV